MPKKITIAIDGPAGAGKSTVAKLVAGRLGFTYVDTGAMYRAVTFIAMEQGFVDDEAKVIELAQNMDIELQFRDNVTHVYVNGREITDMIRTPAVNAKVSDISRIKDVRTAMVKIQKLMGEKGNLVAEGRDTTTVVFPEAELKIFLTASLDERSERRYKEYTSKGEDTTLEDVKASIINRDEIDSGRAVSPLRKADDAVELDSTDMTIPEEVDFIVAKLNEKEFSLEQ